MINGKITSTKIQLGGDIMDKNYDDDYYYRMPWITKRELEELYQSTVEILDVANREVMELTLKLEILQNNKQNPVLREEQTSSLAEPCATVVRLGDEC